MAKEKPQTEEPQLSETEIKAMIYDKIIEMQAANKQAAAAVQRIRELEALLVKPDDVNDPPV